MGSGSSEGDEVYWVTEAEAERLRKYACFECSELLFCPKCKRFECALSRRVPQKSCTFRNYEKFERL